MAWEVYGHDWAVRLLRQDLSSGKPAHAYLFTGADGIGKRTLALQFARAAACAAPPSPGDACGNCRPCRMIPQMRHPDLHILVPEGKSDSILIAAARALTASLALKPLELRHRFALLLDFHRAKTEAANALLKTLEEPPPSAILLLTADSADELLPTIVSRCRVINLRPAGDEIVRTVLRERAGLSAEAAHDLAQLSGGRIGWALTQAGDSEQADLRRERFDAWLGLFRQSRIERFRLAESLAGDRESALETLRAWQSFAHDLQMLMVSPDCPVTNADLLPALRDLAGGVTPESARRWFAALRRAEEGIDRNANPRLALQAAFLDAPGLR